MVSNTKAKLEKKQLSPLLSLAGITEPVTEIRELTDGWFNTAYQAEFSSRSPVVMKISPPDDIPILRYEHDIMRAEAEVMEILSDRGTVPVPSLIHSDFSRSVIPHDFLVMESLPGIPLNRADQEMSKADKERIVAESGRINAQINEITGEWFGYWCSHPKFKTWYSSFCYMIECILQDAQDFSILLPHPSDEIRSFLTECEQFFQEVTTPVLVHWDLWEGNIFVDRIKGNWEITGIIDFERALWGDPLMEALFQNGFERQAFTRGYGRSGEITIAEGIRRLWYDIYLELVLIIEDGPRQYPEKHTIQWGIDRLKTHMGMLKEVIRGGL